MNNQDLFDCAEDIQIDYIDLPKNKALSVKIGQNRYIGIDKNIAFDSAEERTLLAHEIGHQKTNAFYNFNASMMERRKQEHKAVKWAVLHCVPKSELLQLLRKKYNVFEIAEYFGVTYDFIVTAYMYYFSERGLSA